MMRTALIAFAVALASGAGATPALDAAGKCRDNGKFVAASRCHGPGTGSGKCRDKTTKRFAKCGDPNAEPVPKKK